MAEMAKTDQATQVAEKRQVPQLGRALDANTHDGPTQRLDRTTLPSLDTRRFRPPGLLLLRPRSRSRTSRFLLLRLAPSGSRTSHLNRIRRVWKRSRILDHVLCFRPAIRSEGSALSSDRKDPPYHPIGGIRPTIPSVYATYWWAYAQGKLTG